MEPKASAEYWLFDPAVWFVPYENYWSDRQVYREDFNPEHLS